MVKVFRFPWRAWGGLGTSHCPYSSMAWGLGSLGFPLKCLYRTPEYASSRRVYEAQWPVKVREGPLNAFSWAPPSIHHPSPILASTAYLPTQLWPSGSFAISKSSARQARRRVPQIDCQIIIFSLAFTPATLSFSSLSMPVSLLF
jgi:hypothetical protein